MEDEPIVNQDSRTATSIGSLRVATFAEECGRAAGQPLDRYAFKDPYLSKSPMFALRTKDPSALYHPFANKGDYEIAALFSKFKTTKGFVNKFKRDPLLTDMSGQCSFRNGNKFKAKLHGILWGIKNDKWTRATINLDTNVANLGAASCTVYHRDVIQVLRFLMSHGLFKDNLMYTLERHYTSAENTRVYSKMHTGDWWWSMQERLDKGATVVPLLLATDKTMLTQHYGNFAMWPVYITIGNLDVGTRKNQTRPGMVLLGLIPVAKLGKKHHWDSKAAIYHRAMSMMLACTYRLRRLCLHSVATLTEPVGGSVGETVANRVCHVVRGRFHQALPSHHRRHDG